MNDQLKDELLKILNIIQFQGDKQKFARLLSEQLSIRALVEILKERTTEERKTFQELINANSQDPKPAIAYLESKIGKEKMQQVFIKVFKEHLSEYFQVVLPTLKEEQVAQLETYRQNLPQQPSE